MEEDKALKLFVEEVEETLQITGQEPIKVWLRPLSYPIEKSRVWMAMRETYRLLIESGASEEDAQEGAYLANRLQTLFFVIRKSSGSKAERLFSTTRELGGVPPVEQERLMLKWIENFELTETELGNLLRARVN